MSDDEQNLRNHGPRKRFDTLLVDPSCTRGDCRLIRRALRQGWVQGEDVVTLVEDFYSKASLSEDRPPLTRPVRSGLAVCEVTVDIARMTLNEIVRSLPWYRSQGGRPRERPIANDPNRISAAVLQKSVPDPVYVRQSFGFTWHTMAGDKREQSLRAEWVPISAMKWKLWLICPRCRRRRAFMYIDCAGLGCRVCTRARYAARSR